jgi:hypothetical protein
MGPGAAAYNPTNGQPIYYPGYPHTFETQESVLGVGEVADKEKEKSEDNIEGVGTAPEVSATTQLVALEDKKENGDTKDQRKSKSKCTHHHQVPPLENIKVDDK